MVGALGSDAFSTIRFAIQSRLRCTAASREIAAKE
jgi:hypothetical protein